MEKKGKDTVAVKTNPMREAFDMAMEYAMTPVETPKATPVKTPVVPVKATLPTAKAQPVVTPPQIGKKGSKSNVGNYTPFFTSLGISTPVPTGAVGSKADIQSGLKTNPTVEVLDDNGKVVQGSLNVFAGMGTKRTDSYGKVTGGKFMFKSADGKRTQLVSGSIDDIGNAFDSFKGNDKHVEVYTLDNGTYGPGLRYRDQNLTSERLKAYDAANTTGGSGLYVKSIPKTNMTPVTGTKFRSDTALTKNVRTEKDASYLKGHGLTNEQKAIVLHHTANWNVNDALKVMNNNERSSHVVIDVDGRRVVMAKPDQVAFHAGESNYKGRDNVNDFGLGQLLMVFGETFLTKHQFV